MAALLFLSPVSASGVTFRLVTTGLDYSSKGSALFRRWRL
jgi:hypothetical protein